MNDLVVLLGLFVAVWGLALALLKRIVSSANAQQELKDAAEASVIALHTVAALVAAAALGWNLDNNPYEAIFAVLIFGIPFIAMTTIYLRKKSHRVWAWGPVALYLTVIVVAGFAFGGRWLDPMFKSLHLLEG